MENEVVQVVEATEPVVTETVKKMPAKGKTGLIIAGTALGVAGTYLLVTKVIIPKVGKKPHKKEEEVVEVEAEEVAEAKHDKK